MAANGKVGFPNLLELTWRDAGDGGHRAVDFNVPTASFQSSFTLLFLPFRVEVFTPCHCMLEVCKLFHIS